MKYLSVKAGEAVCVHIAHHGNKEMCISGKVHEVKAHTGIVICEFFVEERKYFESFRMENGVSVRGKQWGHITQLSCETERSLTEAIGKAREAWHADNREKFEKMQEEILHIVIPSTEHGINTRLLTEVKQRLIFFCKGADTDPAKTAQNIIVCTKKR